MPRTSRTVGLCVITSYSIHYTKLYEDHLAVVGHDQGGVADEEKLEVAGRGGDDIPTDHGCGLQMESREQQEDKGGKDGAHFKYLTVIGRETTSAYIVEEFRRKVNRQLSSELKKVEKINCCRERFPPR